MQYDRKGVQVKEGEGGVNTLKLEREKLDMTQKEVSVLARIPERQYQYYEHDKKEPGVRKAIRIAKALNKNVGDMEDLFGAATPEASDGNQSI